jgi:hypothetical protein
MPHDPEEPVRERELERRRDNELKDLETEADHSQRPLEGLSHATGTTWTREQDERSAHLHEHDEERSREASEAQVLPPPPHHHEE